MNYMEQVAEMLGVEIGEEFDVYKHNDNLYVRKMRITQDGLFNEDGVEYPGTLGNIMKGTYTIQNRPFKPKNGERYSFVNARGEVILACFDYNCHIDLNNYKQGNCFKTEELAKKAKPTIMAKFDAIRKELEG